MDTPKAPEINKAIQTPPTSKLGFKLLSEVSKTAFSWGAGSICLLAVQNINYIIGVACVNLIFMAILTNRK